MNIHTSDQILKFFFLVISNIEVLFWGRSVETERRKESENVKKALNRAIREQ